MTAQFYDDDILQPVMILFLLRPPGLIFQHDNARLHTARVAINCLQTCSILLWPILPDLFPILPIRDVMRRRLEKDMRRQPSPNTNDLVQQLKTIWQENLQNTIQSTRCRMTARFQATSGPTPYSFPPFVVTKFEIKSINCSEILIVCFSMFVLDTH